MAGKYPVSGEQYRVIDRRMREIKRQLDLQGGSSLNPQQVTLDLQNIIEGRGHSQVVIKTYVIDCNAHPYEPVDWKVKEHIKGGELIWNPDEVLLYLCDEQKVDSIKGNKLRQKLKGKAVLNACVLDYLLANPQLIPEQWKGKAVCFWGTIYRHLSGRLYVRYLDWDDGGWHWDRYCLDSHFWDHNPAALSCKTYSPLDLIAVASLGL